MSELPLVFAVIDDDASMRRLVSGIITSMGDAVVEATTYAEGMVVLGEYPWDIALIDRRLPDGDGTDLCRNAGMRQSTETHRHLVIISSMGTQEERLEGFEAGADDYIVKPIDPVELRARLRAVRRAAATQKQLLSRLSALEQLSVIDDLTHVYNHRFFDGELRRTIALSTRHARPLALMMIDVDHFKRVNDVHGHPVGDLVLADISTSIAQNVRGSDIVARYGGEEFAVILPETTLSEAIDAAERVRAGVEASAISHGAIQLRVTVSIGLAGIPNSSINSAAGLIEAADSALYTAKSKGRNRVVRYEAAGQGPKATAPPTAAGTDGQLPNPV